MRRSRTRRALLAAAAAAAVLALSAPARAAETADTSLVWRWSTVYRSRLYIDRESRRFPWNDEAGKSYLNDRLAILGELSWRNELSLFAKGATGYRLDWPYQDEQFILDQWHAGFDVVGGLVTGRLFARERVYRTSQRLIVLSSDDNWFTNYGEGLALHLNARYGSLTYVESALRYDYTVHGGLPSFEEEDDFVRLARLEAFQAKRWHAGVTGSELRAGAYGDYVTVGADAGVTVRGIDFLAELARTREGGWEDFRRGALFPLSWKETGDLSDVFSDDEAFAAEIEGLELDLGPSGTIAVVPGYRYAGSEFANVQGEWIPPGTEETYALAWWKSATYDALASIDVSTGESLGEDFDRLVGSVRTRYRGGFETRESVFLASGKRGAAAVSFVDDNALSRLALTARIDDLGDGNLLSYLAQGTFNLGSRVAVKGGLLLPREQRSLYTLGIEFRPMERFLFQVSAGSFLPRAEELAIDRDFDYHRYFEENRYVQLFTRIWFGGEGKR